MDGKMTDKQIFELVKEHFTEEWCEEDGNGWVEFSGKPDAFLKFAQAIYVEGYEQHRKDILGEELYYD
jgi:hypothetical protein